MNTKLRLLRLVLASSVGSILWAGCMQPQFVTARFDPAQVAYAPIDLLKARPDTHPELRNGLGQTFFPYAGGGMIARGPQATAAAGAFYEVPQIVAERLSLVDWTWLEVFNPEVISVATTTPDTWGDYASRSYERMTYATAQPAPGVVVEPAGAQPGVTVQAPAAAAPRLTPAQQRWQGGLITTEEY